VQITLHEDRKHLYDAQNEVGVPMKSALRDGVSKNNFIMH